MFVVELDRGWLVSLVSWRVWLVEVLLVEVLLEGCWWRLIAQVAGRFRWKGAWLWDVDLKYTYWELWSVDFQCIRARSLMVFQCKPQFKPKFGLCILWYITNFFGLNSNLSAWIYDWDTSKQSHPTSATQVHCQQYGGLWDFGVAHTSAMVAVFLSNRWVFCLQYFYSRNSVSLVESSSVISTTWSSCLGHERLANRF